MFEPPTSLFHVIILVADMERSLSFYRDVLDFKVLMDERDFELVPGSGQDVSFALLERADDVQGAVELANVPGVKPKPIQNAVSTDAGFWAATFDVEDVEKIYHDWKKRGVNFLTPPTIQNIPNWGALFAAIMTDIDGNQIELVQASFMKELSDKRRALWKEATSEH